MEVGADPVAAVVAEGAAKPEAAFTLTPKTAALDTLAHWVQITRQALEDATYIRSLIEVKLRRGLLNKAEADMAAAIDASTAVQTATATAAPGRACWQSIRVGIGKVRGGRVQPERRRVEPGRLRRARHRRDGRRQLDTGPIAADVLGDDARSPPRRSRPARRTSGDFQAGATLFDRGVTNVFLSDSHASLFISNILVILAEARVKSAVTEPLALCECTAIP